MSFKDISYLQLWRTFSAEQNYLCNFGRVYHKEKFCEIIFNLNQWFSRCRLQDFLPGDLVALVFCSRTIYAINLSRGHNGEYSCEIIINLGQWFRRRCCLKKKSKHDVCQTTDTG